MTHVPIRVSTLRGDQPVKFDAFVKVNEKHILYIRKGDSFEGNRLNRLKEKKLKKMFIVETDEPQYRSYLEQNIEMAFDRKSGKTLEDRADIAQGSTQANAEEVLENASSEQGYKTAKEGVSRFVEFLTQEDGAISRILGMENLDNNIAMHGVAVSSLSIGLANRIGMKDPKQTQLLSLGGLLHDYEHFQSGLNISRPMKDFSPEDLAIYKAHPLEGGKKLQDKKHFDQAVLNIIVQHEEQSNGKGFPQKLMEAKIDPLALIVGAANKLDRLISFEKVPKTEAGKQLMLQYTGCYPLEYLRLLGEILKI